MGDAVRMGVVGVGYLGGLHASKYAQIENVDLVGVFDLDRARAEKVAADSGARVFDSAAELYAEVEAVSIAVPTVHHLETGLAACERGIHILMEKPLANNPIDARRLLEAAEQAGIVMQVGHLERFNPVFRGLRELVRRPRFIECHRLSPFAGRGGDTNVVYDVMIHDLDLIDFLVGDDLVEVEAIGVPVLSREMDIANARLKFAGGCIANVTASRVSLKRERKLRIFEPEAYVSVDFDGGRVVIARRKNSADIEPSVSPMESVSVEEREVGAGDALLEELRSFVRCVRTGDAPVVGAGEALRAIETAERVVGAIKA